METVTGYFFGYDGKWLTKEEYDERVSKARAEEERRRQWEREHPDFEYDW